MGQYPTHQRIVNTLMSPKFDRSELVEIGERMGSVRGEHRLTQQQAAERMGASISSYRKAETGERGMSEEKYDAFCEAFGVRRDWLLKGLGGRTATKDVAVYALREDAGRHMVREGAPAPENWREKVVRTLEEEEGQIEYAMRKMKLPLAVVLERIGERIEQEDA
jgi:transcriptional regulator with XRE-family HTH domain